MTAQDQRSQDQIGAARAPNWRRIVVAVLLVVLVLGVVPIVLLSVIGMVALSLGSCDPPSHWDEVKNLRLVVEVPPSSREIARHSVDCERTTVAGRGEAPVITRRYRSDAPRPALREFYESVFQQEGWRRSGADSDPAASHAETHITGPHCTIGFVGYDSGDSSAATEVTVVVEPSDRCT